MKRILFFLSILTTTAFATTTGGTLTVDGNGNIVYPISATTFKTANSIAGTGSGVTSFNTRTGTVTLAPSDLSTGNGFGTGVATAAGNATNSSSGLPTLDGANALNQFLSLPSGLATTLMCIGDSTTLGNGVTDTRQTFPCMFSTFGFGLNGTIAYNFGWSGYTTFSVNAIYSTNESITAWTGGTLASSTVSTCPNNMASGSYMTILLGTNDYYGHRWNCTINNSIHLTGMSSQTYLTDSAGHSRVVTLGDAVSGTGIPAGATVATIVSGSAVDISAPTTGGSQTSLVTFTPSPTSSTFTTDLTNIVNKAIATVGTASRVLLCTIPPANNTSAATNNSGAQGDFQANRLVYNTAITALAASSGATLCDLASYTPLGTFNAANFNADLLHENFHGNQLIALKENATLISLVTPSLWSYGFGSESVPDTALSPNIPFLNAANVFTADQTIGAAGAAATTHNLTVYGNLNLTGGLSNSNGGPSLTQTATTGSAIRFNQVSAGVTNYINTDNVGAMSIVSAGTTLLLYGNTSTTISSPALTFNGSTMTASSAAVTFSTITTSGITCNGSSNTNVIQAQNASNAALHTYKDSSANFKMQVGYVGSSLGIYYGTGTAGNEILAYAGTLFGSTPAGVATPPWSVDGSGNWTALGNYTFTTAGKGVQLQSGSNARVGSGTLVGGTLAVANTSITSKSRVFVQDTGGGVLANIGALTVPSKTAATGFTVTSTNALDTSTFDYWIIEVN